VYPEKEIGGTYAVRGAVAEQSPGTKSALEHHLRRRVSAGQFKWQSPVNQSINQSINVTSVAMNL
jgi:hypothetical protein